MKYIDGKLYTPPQWNYLSNLPTLKDLPKASIILISTMSAVVSEVQAASEGEAEVEIAYEVQAASEGEAIYLLSYCLHLLRCL